jgi:hypothetical protein
LIPVQLGQSTTLHIFLALYQSSAGINQTVKRLSERRHKDKALNKKLNQRSKLYNVVDGQHSNRKENQATEKNIEY